MPYRKSILLSLFCVIYSLEVKSLSLEPAERNDSMTLMQAYINLSLTETYFGSLKNERVSKIITYETKELATLKDEGFRKANKTLYNFTLALLHYNNAMLLGRQKKTYKRKDLIEINYSLGNAIYYFNTANISISSLRQSENSGFYELVHFNVETCQNLKRNIIFLKSRFAPLFNKDIYPDFKRIFYLSKKTNIFYPDSLNYYVSIYNMPLLPKIFDDYEPEQIISSEGKLSVDTKNACALGLDLISRYLQFSALVNSKAPVNLRYRDSCNLYSSFNLFLTLLNPKSKLKFGDEDDLLKKDNFFNTELNTKVCTQLNNKLLLRYSKDIECPHIGNSYESTDPKSSLKPGEKSSKFFFDPPKPSSKIFAKNFQLNLNTNKDKDNYLRDILLKAKYEGHINYYYNRGFGFTITTSLEKVNADGTPKGADYRWSASNSGVGTFSYYEIFNSIFLDIESDYRMFAFIVDNKSAENRTTGASMIELQNLEKRSYDALPKDLEGLAGGKTLSIFVYLFHNDSMDGVPKMVMNPGLDFGKYLTNAGLGKLNENRLTK